MGCGAVLPVGTGEHRDQADIPAEQSSACSEARIPASDGDSGRTGDPCWSPAQGARRAVCLRRVASAAWSSSDPRTGRLPGGGQGPSIGWLAAGCPLPIHGGEQTTSCRFRGFSGGRKRCRSQSNETSPAGRYELTDPAVSSGLRSAHSRPAGGWQLQFCPAGRRTGAAAFASWRYPGRENASELPNAA